MPDPFFRFMGNYGRSVKLCCNLYPKKYNLYHNSCHFIRVCYSDDRW